MTIDNSGDDRLDMLAVQLTAALDEIRAMRSGLVATPASILANGFPGPVASNEIIASSWGNATSDSFTRLNGRLPVAANVIGNGGTSGGSWPIQSYTLPAQPSAGYLVAWSHVRCDFNGGSSYSVQMTIGGAFVAQFSFAPVSLLAAGATSMARLSGMSPVVANTPIGVAVNGVGAANITTYADPVHNRLDVIFVPARI